MTGALKKEGLDPITPVFVACVKEGYTGHTLIIPNLLFPLQNKILKQRS